MSGYKRMWRRLLGDRRAAVCLGILAAELLCVLFLPPLLGLEQDARSPAAGTVQEPDALSGAPARATAESAASGAPAAA